MGEAFETAVLSNCVDGLVALRPLMSWWSSEYTMSILRMLSVTAHVQVDVVRALWRWRKIAGKCRGHLEAFWPSL